MQQSLDKYEQDQDFTPVFIEFKKAIQNNRNILDKSPKDMNEWVQRETDVLIEVLKREDLLKNKG